ncbi:MAG: CDGSH iron-sulfur domain-containing protein [Methanoregula sp.]|nr:CDGSH iron-sulfur domain-containing protein [Methanoregula sp.]
MIIEYPAKGKHGPLWVCRSIPLVSADGKTSTIRNRPTLCRCGSSDNKPFCDRSNIQR